MCSTLFRAGATPTSVYMHVPQSCCNLGGSLAVTAKQAKGMACAVASQTEVVRMRQRLLVSRFALGGIIV